jgi:hypothetical protein
MLCFFINSDGTFCSHTCYRNWSCRYHKRRINPVYQGYLTELHKIIRRKGLSNKVSIARDILQNSSKIRLEVNKVFGTTGWVVTNTRAMNDFCVLPSAHICSKVVLQNILQTYSTLHPNEIYPSTIWYYINALIGQNIVRNTRVSYTTGDCIKFIWYTLFSDEIIVRLTS